MQDLDPDQFALLIVQQYLHEHGYTSGAVNTLLKHYKGQQIGTLSEP